MHTEMLKAHFQHNLHFLNNFYKCLKTFPVKPQFLELFYKHLINVFTKDVCIKNVYKTFSFKHYSVKVYLEMFINQKIGFIMFCKHLN